MYTFDQICKNNSNYKYILKFREAFMLTEKILKTQFQCTNIFLSYSRKDIQQIVVILYRKVSFHQDEI